jgi:sugar phosphate isomerase/epimerase
MATDYKFLIPFGRERRDERLAYAENRDLGLEVTAFIGGGALNDPADRDVLESEIESELAGFSGLKTMHGAFLDLAIHSDDDRISAISKSRIERDVLTALRLGCEKVVFHMGYNPLVPGERYRQKLVESQVNFWSYILGSYPGITICLENQWETDWTIFQEIFATLQHPHLGMCLDVAHAHVYGHYSPEAWIEAIPTQVRHMHWSDNCGDRDSHLPLGAGNIAWTPIFASGDLWKTVTVTLEVAETSGIQRSLAFLSRRGLIPAVSTGRESKSPLMATPAGTNI